MAKRFQNKTVLILGGTSGIGRTTALLFAREGANVVIGGRNADNGNEVVRSIEAMDGNGLYVQTDVTRLDALQNAIGRTVETFGGLNVAFNNAGLAGTGNKAADESEADWLDMINSMKEFKLSMIGDRQKSAWFFQTLNMINTLHYQEGSKVAETITDVFGEFKFDKLEPGSGMCVLKVRHETLGAASCEVALPGSDSVDVGVVSLRSAKPDENK